MTKEIQNWVSINVHIAGRVYPLTIQSEQEDLVRTIAKDLNERVAQYQMQYTHKDKQDCIVMAIMAWALAFVNTTNADNAQQKTQHNLLQQQMEVLHNILNQALQA